MVWARHEDGRRSRSEESDDESDTGEKEERETKDKVERCVQEGHADCRTERAMKETGLTGKRRSTTIAATPDDGKSQGKRRRRHNPCTHTQIYKFIKITIIHTHPKVSLR